MLEVWKSTMGRRNKMTNDKIFEAARQAGFVELDELIYWQYGGIDLTKELTEFWNIAQQQGIQNCKVRIPSSAMEQEFAKHYKRGFEAGKQQAIKDYIAN